MRVASIRWVGLFIGMCPSNHAPFTWLKGTPGSGRPAKKSRVASEKAKPNNSLTFLKPVAARPAGEIQSQETMVAEGTQETEVVYSQGMLRTMMEEPW